MSKLSNSRKSADNRLRLAAAAGLGCSAILLLGAAPRQPVRFNPFSPSVSTGRAPESPGHSTSAKDVKPVEASKPDTDKNKDKDKDDDDHVDVPKKPKHRTPHVPPHHKHHDDDDHHGGDHHDR